MGEGKSQMAKKTDVAKKSLLWVFPRILGIGLALFFFVFTLDSFGEKISLLAWLIHATPAFISLGLVLLAWNRPKIGAVAYTLAGMVAAGFFHSVWLAIPELIIAVLFTFEGFKK